jgi:hypothetical protein
MFGTTHERPATLAWLVVCAGWLLVVWAWPPAYLTLTVDDSFYVFVTAAHAAAGQGPTFDGIAATNGFHPLWMLVVLPLGWVAADDMERFARLALSLDVALLFFGILLVVRGAAAGGVRWVAAVLMLSFYSAKAVVNGLESALQLFFLAWALAASAANGVGRSQARRAGIAVLCGLATLARLDAVFFGLTMCAMPILWPSADEASRPFRERIRTTLFMLAVMALVVAPYFVYNLAVFHHAMPVSGAIKAAAVHSRSPIVRLGLPLVSLFALGLLLLYGRTRDSARGTFLRFVFPLASYLALETAYNALVRGIVVPEIWYLAPHLLLAILVLGHLLGSSVTRPALRWAVAIALVGFAVLSIAAWRVRLDPRSYSSYVAQRKAGEWLDQHSAKDALIAGWDCGIAAAHSKRRFINLDGLINSWDYKEQYLDRGRVYEYITHVHPVDYVCQYVTLGSFDGTIRGLDFARDGWNVVYQDRVPFRSILTPWRMRTDVQLILTRRSEGTPFDRVADRLVQDARAGS